MVSDEERDMLYNSLSKMPESEVLSLAEEFDIDVSGMTKGEVISKLMTSQDEGNISVDQIPEDADEPEPEPEPSDEPIQESELQPDTSDIVSPQTTTGDSQPSEEPDDGTDVGESSSEDTEPPLFTPNMKEVRATQSIGKSPPTPNENNEQPIHQGSQRAATPTFEETSVPSTNHADLPGISEPQMPPIAQQQASANETPYQQLLSDEEKQQITKEYLQEIHKMRPDNKYGYIREDPETGDLYLVVQMAPSDREKIVNMGAILQDMGHIVVNHPALTIKFALNLLNSHMKTYVREQYTRLKNQLIQQGGQQR